ncbi:NADP-dependent oxidoreductase [Frankia sp. Cj5]|uniref:NADP-dependent oxidoreductase n=1 Tax=Frankia sp. Cj5 TaxID=2880978 RepID=UPI001EF6E40F|nr:NADP-dependent oxidoreductase [Frankia sp. Cj5]
MSTAGRHTRVVTLARRPGPGGPAPEDFTLTERAVPELGAGQLLVRNAFMSVDPSMRGRLEETEKHYTTNFAVGEPLDGSAIGRVLASRVPGIHPGAWVRHRLGWRELAIVEATPGSPAAFSAVDAARAAPSAWLGILGQTGFTAYAGLLRAGKLARGDAVFVSAAGGAVGSAVGQLARLLGAASVIGSAGSVAKCHLLTTELGFDAAVDYRAEPIAAGLGRAAPDGIDLYFDNVGGDHLVAALHALRVGGRVVLCGMISQFTSTAPQPGIDHLIQAVLRRVTLRGFIIRDHEDLRTEFTDRVSGWLRTGELVSRQTVVDGLENASAAFLGMLRGDNVGKMLVRVDPDVEA